MRHLVALGMTGIVGLYGLARWIGVPGTTMFWMLLPIVTGWFALSLWAHAQRRRDAAADFASIDRWAKGISVAYLIGVIVAVCVIGRSSPHAVTNYRLPTAAAEPVKHAEETSEFKESCPFSKGDPIEKVKAFYGIVSEPHALSKVTPAGTAFQYHFSQYGI